MAVPINAAVRTAGIIAFRDIATTLSLLYRLNDRGMNRGLAGHTAPNKVISSKMRSQELSETSWANNAGWLMMGGDQIRIDRPDTLAAFW
jgi:hypothetical protein